MWQFERHYLRVFLRCPGVEDDYFVILPYLAPRAQHLETVETDSRLRTNAEPLRSGHLLHPVHNTLLAAGNRATAAGPNRVKHHKVADGRRHTQAAGDGMGVR